MWQETQQIFAESFARFTSALAGMLPAVLAMLAILLLTLMVAGLVRFVVRRFLEKVGFDRRVRQWGFAGTPPWTGGPSPSLIIARVVYWVMIVLGLAAALNALSTAGASALAVRLLGYLPQVVVAAVVFVVGLGAASVIERNVLISAVNMQLQSARLLSLGAKWLVLVLASAMSLEHLGVGGSIVTLSFAILFGGIVFALALAVGLGSRDLVSKSLEKRMSEQERRSEPPGSVDHL